MKGFAFILIGLVLPSVASGHWVKTPHHPHARQTKTAIGGHNVPLSQLPGVGIRAARSYWHGNPPCGYPAVRSMPMSSNDGRLSEALLDQCAVALSNTYNWTSLNTDWQYVYCLTIVHEWGHLELGPNYFAASNPRDPAHSPDPHNIMYRSLSNQYVAGCQQLPHGHEQYF